jgi:hypothetical protein
MNTRILHHIVGRLSLRPPQAESFSKLVRALEASPASRASACSTEHLPGEALFTPFSSHACGCQSGLAVTVPRVVPA